MWWDGWVWLHGLAGGSNSWCGALIGPDFRKDPINSQCASIANGFRWKPWLNDCGTIILVKWQTAKQISRSMKAFMIDCFSLTRRWVCVCFFVCRVCESVRMFVCVFSVHLSNYRIVIGWVCIQHSECICLMQSHADCFVDPTKTLINVINWQKPTHTWVPWSICGAWGTTT